MLRKLHILFLIFYCSFQVFAQETKRGSEKISLLFIGDIMGHDEQIWSAENRETRTYNYDDVFSCVKGEISEADIAFANLEVTLGGPPYSGYPQFSSPDDLAVACRDAGVDFFVTANNHSADRGRKGIVATVNKLDSLGIPHTGTFIDQAHRDTLYPAIIERNGFSIAVLNYTYGTNGIKVPPPVIVNMIDNILINIDIEKAKSRNPDAVIAFLHWEQSMTPFLQRARPTLPDFCLIAELTLL
jgi:poly-gamma-glutamate synthesis protein (capsule biosynthesis protein)